MNHSQRIILTGASAGIGRALALGYARRGARLVLMARREELLQQLAEEVRTLGAEAAVLAADITAPNASERVLELAHQKYGGVDLVMMNAAVGFPASAYDFNAEQTERVMEVNYFSVVRMIAAVLPQMLAAGRGHIAAVSSLAAYRGMPGSAAYNASKAAVTILMESLRTELRPTGVKVTTIAPGFVRTAMSGQNEFTMPFLMEPEEAARKIIRAIDAGRSEYRFPLATSLAVRFLQILPNPLYDRLVLWARKVGS